MLYKIQRYFFPLPLLLPFDLLPLLHLALTSSAIEKETDDLLYSLTPMSLSCVYCYIFDLKLAKPPRSDKLP